MSHLFYACFFVNVRMYENYRVCSLYHVLVFWCVLILLFYQSFDLGTLLDEGVFASVVAAVVKGTLDSVNSDNTSCMYI